MNANEVLKSYSAIFRKHIPVSDNPAFLFTVYQSLYRMFEFDNKSYNVLHASAAITPTGKTVIFGDDGEASKGKTFCSLLLAVKSNKFIADEYILLQKDTGCIFGNGDIPINLKEGVYDFLTKKYNLDLYDKKAIFANDYFQIVEETKPAFMIIPYLESDVTRVENFSEKDLLNAHKATLFGHNIKFNHPETDVVSLIKGNSNNPPEKTSGFLADYPDTLLDIPTFKAFLDEPDDIFNVVEDIESRLK
jgi:hypothetical protein